MRTLIYLLALGAVQPVSGGLVSITTSAEVSAQFDTAPPDTATSSANSDLITATQAGTGNNSNSSTTSTLDYGFDGAGTFSGIGTVTALKQENSGPGGDHCGIADYSVTFTTDESMDFTLGGTWGYDYGNSNGGGSSGADFLTYLLQDSSGNAISQGTATSTAGVNSEAFMDSGTLPAGTYTFTIRSELYEAINNRDTRQAGFDLTEFTLTSTSTGAGTPEPGSLSLLALGFLVSGGVRRRRSQPISNS